MHKLKRQLVLLLTDVIFFGSNRKTISGFDVTNSLIISDYVLRKQQMIKLGFTEAFQVEYPAF